MRSRYLLCITLLLVCHARMQAQLLTNALPAPGAPQAPGQPSQSPAQEAQQPAPLQAAPTTPLDNQPESQPAPPDEPGLQLLPIARPEPVRQTGVAERIIANQQSLVGNDVILTGEVVLYYKNYIVRADKIVYHRDSASIDADGHIQVEGGASDAVFTATSGEMHLEEHTARFYNVTGSIGLRRLGRTQIYTTPDPFLFTGRVLIQTGEHSYRIVDGTMTSCRLPRPDWQIVAHNIEVANDKATTRNSHFEFLRVPLFYLPFLQRSLDETGRESGILIPVFENSGVKGFVFGEQLYWVINRSMDVTVGAEYWSKRGYAPNGDFRYRGPGLDSLLVRWNGLFDRGINQQDPVSGAIIHTDQGGADILASGRKDFSENTRVAGAVEYLSSYIYRLAFDENFTQATSSEVQSDLALTHNLRGFVPSVSVNRFQSFAGSTGSDGQLVLNVPEVRILHLPSVRFDAVDRPLGETSIYWGLGSSIADLDRAEPHFHARNVGRFDLHPHIEWPLHLGDWNILPEIGVRTTQYSGSQLPDIDGTNFGGVPFVQHNPLNRSDVEASLDIRPPAVERDYTISRWGRQLRHVIEPEIFYRYVTGINNARDTLHFDTTDIATNTNEAGYSLTQRFYLRPSTTKRCESIEPCPTQPREWASWQIAQKFFIDPTFGGALIPDRRNVFDTTLGMTGVAYLTSQRNIAPLISRLRFEAIDHLRIEWDFDYDTKAGRLGSDNLYAGYSVGRTTFGIGQALLNAADEAGSSASLIKSHQVQPFLFFGKPSDVGLSIGMNASYDTTHNSLQYGGVETVYNWNCCGLNVGYRRFSLGSLRDESEWLWGFTLANLGSAGNIRRSTSVFPTPDMLKRMY